ncbi:uncharacterized protein LOC144452687 [Glandiceps talaboti]
MASGELIDMSPLSPGAVTVTAGTITQTTLSFTWVAAVGDFDLYEVYYRSGGGQDELAGTVVKGGNPEMTLEKLTPNTEYTISVNTVKGTGDYVMRSGPSEAVASTAEEILTFTPTGTTLLVEWVIQSGVFARYELGFDPAHGDDAPPVVVNQGQQTQALLRNLIPGTKYDFTLSTVTAEDVKTQVIATPFTLPPLPVASLNVQAGITDVIVTWLPQTNGVFDHYLVTVNSEETISVTLGKSGCPQVHVYGIEAKATHEVNVYTVSENTQSSPTTKHFKTGEPVPGNMYFGEITEVSMEVFWFEYPEEFQEYNLEWSNSVTSQVLGNQQVAQDAEKKVVLSGLTPGLVYNLTLTTMNGGMVNTTLHSTTQATVPLPPGDISFTAASNSSVNITWPGIPDGRYEVCYDPVGAKVSPIVLDVDINDVHLDGLDEAEIYIVSVATIAGDGDGKSYSDKSTTYVQLSEGTPGDIEVVTFTETTIVVSWLGDENRETDYILSIQPYDQSSVPTEYTLPAAIDPLTFVFTGINPAILYRIKLKLKNTLTERTITQRTRPNRPGFISVLPPTAVSVTIAWYPPTGPFDSILITYAENNVVNAPETTAGIVDKTVESFTIEDLKPDTSYQIKLYARVGTGSQAIVSYARGTTTRTAFVQPGAVVVTEFTNDTITVVWGDVPTATGFFLSLTPPDMTSVNFPYFVTADSTGYTFSDLNAGTQYQIQVRSDVPPPGTVTDQTISQYTVPNAPGDLSANVTSALALQIMWGEADGQFDHYEISYAETEEGPTVVTGTVARGDERYFDFENLSPITNYTFSVVTVVGTGDDELKSTASVFTVSTDALEELQVIVIEYTKTNMSILWGSTQRPGVAAYLIDLTPSDGAQYPLAITTAEERSFVFNGLVPGREYTIEVGVTSYPEKGTKTQRTIPNAATNLRSSGQTPTAITVQWDAPSFGGDETYMLTYEPADGLTSSPLTLAQSTAQQTFEGLTPSTEYTFTLSVVSGTGSGKTESDAVTATSSTTAAAPAAVIIKTVTTTSIAITWGVVPDVLQFDGYVIRHEPPDGSPNTHPVSKTDPRRVEFTGLNPGTLYTIYVNVQGQEIVGSKEQRTLPNAPGDITVSDTEPTSISFSWIAAVGDFDYYEVSYALDGGAVIVADNVDTTSYTLDNLATDSTYDIMVVSVKGSGDDLTKSAESTAQNTTDAVLPEDIFILSVTQVTMTIEWGETENSDATAYAVFATPVTGGNTLTHVAQVDESNQHTFTNLQIGTEYRIKLQIVVPGSKGNESEIAQFTQPSMPGAIIVGTKTPTTIQIGWIPAPGDYNLDYEISYAPNGGVVTVAGSVDKLTTSYELTGLQPDTSYDISVRTVVGTGVNQIRSDPSTVTASSAIIEPGVIILDTVTTNSIDIMWGARDDATGYFITLDPADDGETYPDFVLNTVIRYSFTGLTGGKEYNVTLSYSGIALENAVKTIRTVPRQPGVLTLANADATELTFNWGAASDEFDNYEIYYISGDGTEVFVDTVTSDITTYTIQDLSPGNAYTVEIVTTVGTGDDLVRSQRRSNTFNTATIPAGTIEVRTVTTTSIRILWGKSSDPLAVGYLLSLDPNEGDTYPRVENVDVEDFTFGNLYPGRTYTISLTVSGLTNVGDEVIQATVPTPPVSLSSSAYSPTSVTVTWVAPASEVSSYEAFSTDPQGTSSPAMKLSSDLLEYEFTELEPATVYTFTFKSKVMYDGSEVLLSEETILTQSTTVIPEGDIVVFETTTSSITVLLGESKRDAVSGYLVSISPEDGNPVDFLQKDVIRKTFTNLVSGREYTISNQLAGPNTAKTITVTTKPRPPGPIEVLSAERTSVEITWNSTAGDFDVFEISLEMADGSILDVGVINNDVGTSEYTTTITDLKPNTEYSIHIVTRIGPADAYIRSERSSVTTTTEIIPAGQIQVVEVDINSISILWGATQDPTAQGYVLLLSPQEGGSYPIYRGLDIVSYDFTGLTPGREYTITVQIAGPNLGNTVQARTKPNVPGAITVEKQTPTSLSIKWEPSTGEFSNYEVYYAVEGLQRQFASLLDASKTNYTITNLIPSTRYTIEVASKSGTQKSDFSSVVGTTATIPTAEVALTGVTTNSISVMWGVAQSSSGATGYLVSINPAVSGISYFPLLTIENTFNNLDSGVLYTITVTVLGSSEEGTLEQRTKPTSPAGVIIAGNETETSIDLSITGSATGNFDKYEIFYGRDVNEAILAGEIAADESTPLPLDFTIDGLDPDTEYSIKVQTSAGSGNDAMTSDPFTLTGSTAALAPANVVVLDVTTTTIDIVWGPSSEGSGYVVIAANANEPPRFITLDIGESPKHKFENLTPGTMYSITVQITGTAITESFNQRTRPQAPSNIAVGATTTTSITVVWTSPLGDFDNYEVSYRDPSDVDHFVQVVEAGTNQLTIEGLDHSTTYTVFVVSKIGSGNDEVKSTPTSVDVTTDAIQPGEIIIQDVTTTTIQILWGPYQEQTVGYLIQYDSQITPIFTVSTEYTFTGLVPGRLYEIVISPADNTDVKYTKSQRTKPMQPGAVTVDVTNITPTVIPISWVLATGDVDGYDIVYNTATIPDTLAGSVDDQTLSFSITGLQPGATYVIMVYTRVNGVRSEAQTDSAATVALQPGEIAVVDYSEHAVSITWGPTTDVTAENYVVIASAGADTKAVTIAVGNPTLHEFDGLYAGRLYTISVKVTGSNGDITEQSIEQRTIPLRTQNIYFLSATSTSITISWDTPLVTDYDGFEIAYMADGASKPTVAAKVPKETETYTIDSLTEDTTYALDVITVSGSGDNLMKSDARSTRQATKATVMRIITTTSNFIFVQWAAQTTTFDTYTLTYDPNDGSPASPITGILQTQLTQNIVGLTPGQEYSLALSVVASGTATEIDSVKTRTNPSKPASVTVDDFGSSFIEVSWTAPSDNSIYDHFLVEYTPTAGSTPQPIIVNAVKEKTVRINGLDSSTLYTISVKTVSGSGAFRKESTSVAVATQITAARAEGEITVTEVTHDRITLEWERVSGSSVNYTIEYGLVGPENNVTTITIYTLQKTFSNLIAGREYTFTITASGTTDVVNTIRQFTIPYGPSNLEVQLVASRSLRLTWDAPTDGFFDSYQVTYYPANGETESPSYVVPQANPQVVLEGLIPETKYTIFVSTVSGSGNYRVSSDELMAEATTEPPAAAEINIDRVEDTYISFSWGASQDPSAVYYSVRVSQGVTIVNTHQILVTSGTTNHDFTSLIPGTLYTISVTVYTGASVSTGETDSVVQRTRPSRPGAIDVTKVTQSIMSFTWIASTGNFDLYEISYSTTRGDVVAGTVNRGEELTYTLYDLHPVTAHTISIVTRIGSGDDLMISQASVTTQATTTTVITVVKTAADSLDVSWIPQGGSFTNYEFTYTPTDGSLQSPVEVGKSGNPGVSLQSLTPGTQYLLTVFIVQDDQAQTRQEIGQTTFALEPFAPTDLTVSDIGSSGATLTFTSPSTGNYDNLRIMVEPQASGAGTGNPEVIEIILPNDACPEVKLMGLQPDTEYLVTIRSTTGTSESAPATTTFTTGSAGEGEVQIVEVTSTILKVRWTEVTSDFNQYSLSLTGDDGKNANNIISRSGVREKLYEDLTPGVLYTVVVTTIGAATPISNYAQTRTVPLPPGPASIVAVTDVTVIMSWQSATGDYDSYEICYNPVPERATPSPITVSKTSPLMVTLNDLDPETDYIISVAAVKGDDNSNKMLSAKESVRVTTGLSTKPPQPGAIAVTALTTTTMTVSWVAPESDNFLTYEVTYTPLIGSPDQPIMVEKGTTMVSFTSLIPGTDYTITVVTVAGSGEDVRRSDPQTSTITTTTGTAGHIDIASVTDSTITITWNPPTDNFTDSYVQYTPSDGDAAPLTLVPGEEPRHFEFTGLTAGQEYTITVQTKDVNTVVTTDTITQSTSVGAPPMPVIQGITATGAVIVFTVPDYAYESFQVVIEPKASGAGAGTPLNQIIEVPKSGCPTYTVRGLTSETEYDVSVSTKNGPAISAAVMQSFSTTAMDALEIAVADVTTTTMDVLWGEGEGDFTSYFIYYQPVGTTSNSFLVSKGDDREFAMTGLTAGTQYTITLQQTGNNVQSRSATQYTRPNNLGPINQESADKTEISISWAGSNGNIDGYEICYYPADGVSSPFTVDSTSATLTGLVTDQDYVISVAAYVGSGSERVYSDKSTATLATSLGNPGDIVISDYTDTEISIQWVATPNSVRYTVAHQPADLSSAAVTSSTTSLEYTFSGLLPGVLYDVSVTPVPSSGGTGQTNTVQQRTKPSTPGNLVMVDVDYRSVTVRWTAPSSNNFDRYILSYTPGDGIPTSPINVAKNEQLEFVISSLEHSTQYFFEVVTIIGSGDTEETSEASQADVFTSPAEPGAISVEEVLTTSIRISWVPHDGTVNHYIARYRVTGSGAYSDRTIAGSATEYTLTSLLPGTLFDITILAVGPGTQESVTQRTYPAAPDSIQVVSYTTSTITAAWTVVTLGTFETYEIYYKELPSGGLLYFSSVARGQSPQVSISSLTPDTEYEITVYTKSGTLKSEVATVTQLTKANAPAPGQLTVTAYTSDQVTVSWVAPTSDDLFDAYELVYSPADGTQDETLTIANTVTSQTYTELQPGVLYTFSVYTTVEGLRSNPSSVQQRTAPELPGEITVDTVGTIAMELSWGHATGTFNNYEIIYTPAGGVPSAPVLVSSSASSYTLLGLTPGTVYSIDIRTVSGNEKSDPRSVEQATRGQMPGTISVVQYSTTTIKISWVQASGQFDQYVVTYTPNDGNRAQETLVSQAVLELEFRDLTPGQEYEFGVATKSGALTSSPSTKTQRTKPMSVSSLTINSATATDLAFSWVAPSSGVVDSYEIKYNPASGFIPSPIIVDDSVSSYTLAGLIPDTLYTVEIIALSGNERSDAQSRVERTSQTSGLDLYFTDVQTNRLTVRWTPPTGTFSTYQITYNPLGGTASPTNHNADATELVLTGLTGGRLYTVVISAYTDQGVQVGTNVQKSQRTLPNPPSSLTIGSYTSTSIPISWSQPSVGDHDGYTIYYSPADGASSAVTNIGSSSTSYSLSGLTAGREYFISVVTRSANMRSARVSETQITKPSTVATINVVEVASDSISITWETPDGDHDGFVVSYGQLSETPTEQIYELDDARELLMSGLTSGTAYQITIVTTSGDEESDAATQDVITIPETPTNLAVTNYDTNSITVTWTGPVAQEYDEYTLSWSPANTNGDTEATVAKGVTEYVLSQLTPGQLYSVTLVTKRSTATSDPESITQRTVPTDPGTVTVASATTDSLTVSWVAAVNVFDVYEVVYTPVGTTASPSDVAAGTNQIVLEGLETGETYTVTIKTKSGDEVSGEVSVTDNTVPGRPGEITLDQVHATYIEVSFGAADGVIDEYKLTYTPTNGDIPSPKTIASDTRNIILTGLTPIVEYTIRIYTVTGSRESTFRETVVSTPDEPITLEITVQSYTEDTIALQWTEPTGSFTHYHVTHVPSDGLTHSPVIVDRESQTLTGLTPGEEYVITVQTSIGSTLTEDGLDVLTQRTKPASPGQVIINSIDITEDSIHLSWTRSEGVLTSYEVIYSPENGDFNSPTSVTSDVLDFTLTGLAPATEYTISVKAVAGQESSVARQVSRYTKPPAPTLSIANYDTTSISLEWVPPSGANIAKYKVTLDPARADSTTEFEVSETATSYTINQLTPGRVYTVGIMTVSTVGGTDVNSDADTAVQRTVPTPPLTINVPTDTIGSTSVTVTWTASAGDVSEYRISYTPTTSQQQPIVVLPSETSQDIAGLTNGQSYTFSIISVSGALLSSAITSSAVSTRPFKPGPITVDDVTKNSIDISWVAAPGTGISYQVGYKASDEDGAETTFTTPSTTYQITGLDSFVTYTLTVRTVIGSLTSEPVEYQQRTFGDIPSAVRQFTVALQDPFQVLASFTQPQSPNGVIDIYEVTVRGTLQGNAQHGPFTVEVIADNGQTVYENENLGVFRPGYTYTFTIKARNSFGLSENAVASVPSALTMPLASPRPLPLTSAEIKRKMNPGVTHDTITIILSDDLFDDQYNVIQAYGILVAEASGSPGTVGASPPGYNDVKDFSPIPAYQTSEAVNYFAVIGNRRKRASSLEYTIGNEDCTSDTSTYCNGPLKPLTRYMIKIRAYASDDVYNDTAWSSSISTKYDIWWFGYAIIGIVVLAIFVICLIIICRCCCVKRRRDNDYLYRRDSDQHLVGLENPAYVRNDVRPPSPRYVMKESRPRSPSPSPPLPQPQPVVVQQAPQIVQLPSVKESRQTGLARPVQISKFAEHYRQMAADSEYKFQEEYDDLRPIGTNFSTRVADLPENKPKNRYTNILPYDHTRVKLKESDDGNDYINANYIAGYNSPREYIATQGPLPTTKDDFWRMVWEQNVSTVVMITQCVEKGRVKCDHYWPFDSDPTDYGNITVTMSSESILPEWIVSDFTLEMVKTREVRAVRHFQFTAWPDHGVPETSDALLRFVRTVRGQIPKNSGPAVIHCSAGVGRSGTYMSLDFLLQHLARKENKYIDVFRLVANMRQKRCFMVQTEAQYVFIHRAVLDVLQGRVSDSNWLLSPSGSQAIQYPSKKVDPDEIENLDPNDKMVEL